MSHHQINQPLSETQNIDLSSLNLLPLSQVYTAHQSTSNSKSRVVAKKKNKTIERTSASSGKHLNDSQIVKQGRLSGAQGYEQHAQMQ